MEKLKVPLSLAYKALNTLSKAFSVLNDAKLLKNQDFTLAAEDSIIQRFEYSYESFWKFCKRYLEEKYSLCCF